MDAMDAKVYFPSFYEDSSWKRTSILGGVRHTDLKSVIRPEKKAQVICIVSVYTCKKNVFYCCISHTSFPAVLLPNILSFP